MLKIRYFRLRLPCSIQEFGSLVEKRTKPVAKKNVFLVKRDGNEVILQYTIVRLVTTIEILPDGSERKAGFPTMERYFIRLFQKGEQSYLSIVDPPRGIRIIGEMLEDILDGANYFLESLEITQEIINRHTPKFESVKLVSAKVRDFQVYEGAVGRLEVTSSNGLIPSIAPFLEGRFHRIDSLTYEVILDFTQGLVCYCSNGTVKISGPLVDRAFPLFEESL